MTQPDLAQRLGITKGHVNHWLQGRRQPTNEQVDRLAEELRVEKGWLRGQDAPKATRASGQFYWREQPRDAGRDFGNSNAYATPTDIKTFVRETGQNSKDQAVDGGTVHIRFRVVELTPDSPEFDAFLRAAQLRDGGLLTHLRQAAKTKGAKLASRIRDGLKIIQSRSSIVLVRVDDYGTTGLFGEESGEKGKAFAALIRDNLNSSKLVSSATGSYGVGKAVLWRSSAISTVFVSSRLAPKYEAQDRKGMIRLVGKAELTWHECDGSPYAGPGWYGSPGTDGHSLWVPETDELLRDLQLMRTDLPEGVSADRASGTSILVVGFRDMSSGEDLSKPEDIVKEFVREAALNFWPRILQGKLTMSVERFENNRKVESISVEPSEFVPEFCEAYKAHVQDEVLDFTEADPPEAGPGEIVRRSVEAPIPATKDDVADSMTTHERVTSEATLIVRLAQADGEASDFQQRVALVRGGGLVVQYWSRREIVVGGRPFHAILLTGEAAGQSEEQRIAEQFFRAAEPPAHDKWELTDDLRDNYQRGAGQRIRDLEENATKWLRKIIEPPEDGDDDGPRELMQLLKIGQPEVRPPAATIRRPKSTFDGSCWTVQAEVMITDRSKALSITPRLLLTTESGSPLRLPWKEITAIQGTVDQHETSFITQPGLRGFRFRGQSATSSEGVMAARCRAVLDLRIEEVPHAD